MDSLGAFSVLVPADAPGTFLMPWDIETLADERIAECCGGGGGEGVA